ncbi:MAG: energy-coupling factor transporter transmembrane protein EcfT, partial [Clostridia bacterium]|nr:energy-coupling factor transporter transmembrane protein EcfT [Clostridia bacterium]
MLSDITLGQYYPARSIIHKLDGRVKILLVLALVVMLFIADTPLAYAVTTVFVVLVIVMSKVPFVFVLKGLKPILYILIFTSLLNIFLTDGRILYSIGFLKITYEGLILALTMVVRLVLLVAATSILTLTTSPIMLTNAIERLLSPLKVIKFPAHEIAMMMTIALRFIPTLMEETEKLIKAQSARGIDFASGGILQNIKAMVPILVPLFINSLKRADELALAMECRCYRGGENRTTL